MKKRRLGFLTILMLVCVLAFGMSASAGFKKMPNGKYRYYTSRTKYLKGKKSAKPASVKRWTFKNLRYKGKVYTFCFNEKGYMLTGWQKLYTSAKKGSTGWYYYYFDGNGRMYKNRTCGKRYLQANGRAIMNAYGPNGTYYGADGRAASNTANEGFEITKKGTKYRLADGSYVQKSWKAIRDPATGKVYWYYFYSTGYMARDCKVGSYLVDKEGRKIR